MVESKEKGDESIFGRLFLLWFTTVFWSKYLNFTFTSYTNDIIQQASKPDIMSWTFFNDLKDLQDREMRLNKIDDSIECKTPSWHRTAVEKDNFLVVAAEGHLLAGLVQKRVKFVKLNLLYGILRETLRRSKHTFGFVRREKIGNRAIICKPLLHWKLRRQYSRYCLCLKIIKNKWCMNKNAMKIWEDFQQVSEREGRLKCDRTQYYYAVTLFLVFWALEFTLQSKVLQRLFRKHTFLDAFNSNYRTFWLS